MARSPYLKLLRQVYKLNQYSKQWGIPLNEILGVFQECLNRRTLLQGGINLLAAPLFFPKFSPSHITPTKRSKVLIVGAGIAGLTAGYRLKQAGVPVDIIEANNQIGGRIRTLSNVLGTSLNAELGGEFIDTNHTCLRRLVTELGFNLIDLRETQKGLRQHTYYFNEHQIPLEAIIRDFAPIAEQVKVDLEKIQGFQNYQTKIPEVIALDNTSITAYLEKIQETTPVIKKLIEVAYTTECGLDAEELSCLNLLQLIGTESNKFEIFGDSDERFYIEGGNEQIPRRLAQILNNNIEINTALEAIRILSDGRYLVNLICDGKTLERKYEKIILALPFSMLRKVYLNINLPPVKKLAIDTLSYGTNSKLITSYREKIWRTRYNATASLFSYLGFQNTWETSESTYKDDVGLITNFTGGQKGLLMGTQTPEFHVKKLLSQLEKIFPNINDVWLSNHQAVIVNWYNEPYHQGSYSTYKVGEITQFYGVEQERVGNIFFAGEHCSQRAQGYMEGACETGETAALQILETRGDN